MSSVSPDLVVRFATPSESEPDVWNRLIAANPAGGDFVQTHAFARVKKQYGWNPRFLIFERETGIVSAALVLETQIPFVGRYWYIPRGPGVNSVADTTAHISALLDFCNSQQPDVFCVTFEPLVRETNAPAAETQTALCRDALSQFNALSRPAIQPHTYTAIVPVGLDDEELIKSFIPKCRNMVRRAIRDGCEVYRPDPTPENFRVMHRLMQLVKGGKADLVLRSTAYTETFWEAFIADGLGSFFAIDGEDGKPAVMAFMIQIGNRAFYKDGGSERPRTSPGMSNLLQWRMMLAARQGGATEYDMVGTPPRAQIDNPEHINYTLGKFKLSFAREVTEYVGAFDLCRSPLKYKLWKKFLLPLKARLYRIRYRDNSWF